MHAVEMWDARLDRFGAALESNLAVDFTVSGENVRMRVTLDGMHSAEFTEMQKEGFTSQLTKLDERFGTAATDNASPPS